MTVFGLKTVIFDWNPAISYPPGRSVPSTFGVDELNFCVRNGNRWILIAIITGMAPYTQGHEISKVRGIAVISLKFSPTHKPLHINKDTEFLNVTVCKEYFIQLSFPLISNNTPHLLEKKCSSYTHLWRKIMQSAQYIPYKASHLIATKSELFWDSDFKFLKHLACGVRTSSLSSHDRERFSTGKL